MTIPKCLDFSDYTHYPSDENPTTDAEIQAYLGNQNALTQELSGFIWQPETSMLARQIIRSTSMLPGTHAVVTSAGTTGETEPTWTGAGTTVTDGGVTYIMASINTSIAVTGSGNAVTSVSASNGVITFTKGTTFPTSQPDISGKANAANVHAGTIGQTTASSGSSLAVPYIKTSAQGVITGYGTHTHTVTGFLASGGTAVNASKVANSLTVQQNGATQGTFNGSAATTINIPALPFAICNTSGATKTLTATCSGYKLVTNSIVLVYFKNLINGSGSSAYMTLNIAGTGAKNIDGTNNTHTNIASGLCWFLYDGTKYTKLSRGGGPDTYDDSYGDGD